MLLNIGDKALVTTSDWFYAPDGKSYRAAFGTVKAIRGSEETLGVKTNAKSTNWYVEIGNLLIAGCQIHYAVRTDNCSKEETQSWSADAANGINLYKTPCSIYFADEEYKGVIK